MGWRSRSDPRSPLFTLIVHISVMRISADGQGREGKSTFSICLVPLCDWCGSVHACCLVGVLAERRLRYYAVIGNIRTMEQLSVLNPQRDCQLPGGHITRSPMNTLFNFDPLCGQDLFLIIYATRDCLLFAAKGESGSIQGHRDPSLRAYFGKVTSQLIGWSSILSEKAQSASVLNGRVPKE
ncbi:hypothetical protein NE237_019212 [Protea cynaroides]|uniref:Uncharacterized protein n=1 Tax=Protea cynaroides TaxID=273540 RepID=A0A9Q0QPS0_9MAGN|nr:hypothetical protein NE237_019212 [Protea cynaroides]